MTDSNPPPETRRDPAERGRLGFSRTTLSIIGAVLVLGFLIWVFLP